MGMYSFGKEEFHTYYIPLNVYDSLQEALKRRDDIIGLEVKETRIVA